MKRIGLVCAFPPSRNTGMATVDLSGDQLFRKILPEAEIIHFTLASLSRLPYGDDDIPFRYVELYGNIEKLLGCDLIVYWGDFLHAPSYWEADLYGRLIAHGISDSRRASEDIVYQYHMLENAPEEVLRKTVIFGNTVITNSGLSVSDKRYKNAIRRLYSNAAGVYLRDALSAAKCLPYFSSQDLGQVSQGIDCAFLLTLSAVKCLNGFELPVAKHSGSKPVVGVFFGRTAWIGWLLVFSRLVARKIGGEVRWLPWFVSNKRRKWVANLLGFDASSYGARPGEILSQMLNCDFIITDTYHLCVNAWRHGIPTICVGKGLSLDGTTLDDKKKEVLYKMYGADPFYIFTEDVSSFGRIGSAVSRAASAMLDVRLADEVREAISAHRELALKRLTYAVRKVVGYT